MRSRICAIGVARPRPRLLGGGSLDLAERAARRCLVRSPYPRQEVQLLINAGIYRDRHQYEPAMASLIQDRLRLHRTLDRGRVFSFDLLNGGCGVLSALQILDSMIRTQRIRLGMVVSSERNGDRDRDPDFDVSPSGVALMVDASPTSAQGFGGFVVETLDAYGDCYRSDLDLTVPRGRVVVRRDLEALQRAFLDGSADAIRTLLQRESLRPEEIDRFILPSVAPGFAADLAVRLGVSAARMLAPRQPSNTLTTSTFLSLHQANAASRGAAGQKSVLLSVAAGVTVGCAVYYG